MSQAPVDEDANGGTRLRRGDGSERVPRCPVERKLRAAEPVECTRRASLQSTALFNRTPEAHDVDAWDTPEVGRSRHEVETPNGRRFGCPERVAALLRRDHAEQIPPRAPRQVSAELAFEFANARCAPDYAFIGKHAAIGERRSL